MAAPYKWYVPDASAGGDGDSYETAYNDINTAFSALSATYYILNIVPTLTGVIPSAPIANVTKKGSIITFHYQVRLTNSAGEVLPYTSRFIIDGNNSLLNIITFVDCAYWELRGLTFKRATGDNIQGLTTASTYMNFVDCDSILSGSGNGVNVISHSSTYWRYKRGSYSNNALQGIAWTGTLNVFEADGVSILNNGGAYQIQLTANSSLRNSIVANGLRATNVVSANALIQNCIFDNHSILTHNIGNSINKYLDCLIKNSPIGFNGTTQAYIADNITYYNVTDPRTNTTGKPLIGKETILDYDPTDANYNQLAKVPTRREIVNMNGFSFGVTAGIPGADVIYPRIDSLDKTVLPLAGGTIVATGIGLTGATGFTLGGVACTVVVDSDTQITITVPTLTAGLKSLAGTTTAGAVSLANCVTAQAGASAPGAVTVTGYATGKYANLSWTMAATSVTYDIEIDGVVYTGYTSLSAEIAMARANTEYSFRVRGVNATGNGAWSTVITVKTEQVADDETIALAGTAVLSSVEDLTGTLHIAQGMTGVKIFDPIILPSAISQETFEYYVKDVLYNQGRNVL